MDDLLVNSVLAGNPARAIRSLPEGKTQGRRSRSLPLGEFRRFITTVEEMSGNGLSEDIARLLLAAAWTGMRRGEILAVKWEDYVDEEIRVERAVYRRQEKTTKTDDPRRIVVVEPLAQVLAEQRRWLLTSQHPGISSGLIFPANPRQAMAGAKRRGEDKPSWHRSPTIFHLPLAKVVKEAKITDISGHSLRRTWENLDPARLLLAVARADQPGMASEVFPERPGIPLSQSDLLVNARDERGVGAEIKKEIASADRIDLVCSFIKWAGFRLVRDELGRWLEQGGQMRVLTTTYVGVTERRALEALRELGAEVRVSYDTRRTRLHAKAWLFQRETGYSTAYIGSSNLSASAMTDGLEWNVRLSQVDAGEVLEKFRRTFESYWQDDEFEPFEAQRFDQERRAQRRSDDSSYVAMDLRPYPFQQAILDRLEVERERHDRWRNLVVAATGTGKTVVAALDYKRWCARWAVASADNPTLHPAKQRADRVRQAATPRGRGDRAPEMRWRRPANTTVPSLFAEAEQDALYFSPRGWHSRLCCRLTIPSRINACEGAQPQRHTRVTPGRQTRRRPPRPPPTLPRRAARHPRQTSRRPSVRQRPSEASIPAHRRCHEPPRRAAVTGPSSCLCSDEPALPALRSWTDSTRL